MDVVNGIIESANGVLFHEVVVFVLLATGILFTIWSRFAQYRALSHGVAVTRGLYDDPDDPGAINHFQALSAALSATVGLGNIGGVALAIALGGPGAVLWMWVIGLVGMALKITEVTQSMLYRNTSDPDNPHGGPMFVVRDGFRKWGLGTLGSMIGGIFVITLLTSAITDGNMFQAWNVADVTRQYFQIPQVVTGIVLSVIVGLVIIGGIKRIGSVAGKLVPAMCVMYVLAAIFVLLVNITEIPAMLLLIVRSGLPTWLGGSAVDPGGAFMGASFGYAAMWGIKRALFSSEAGQGSAPIAHSAAKTDEPVREGVVAGLEPCVDTLVVCTMTALVILSTGAWNRAPETYVDSSQVSVEQITDEQGNPLWEITTPNLGDMTDEAKRVLRIVDGPGWSAEKSVFMLMNSGENADQGNSLMRVSGTVIRDGDNGWTVDWQSFEADPAPQLVQAPEQPGQIGIFGDYAGASLTAHAFDRTTPGLGMWLVTLAAWLFAISTMISWSYYGEQGVVYLFSRGGVKVTNSAVLLYKLIYCLLILLTTLASMQLFGPAENKRALIGTDAELDMWTTLGLGVMLWANIPIMLIFGSQAMKAYHHYMGKLDRGEFKAHEPPSITDVIEGHDVE